MTQINPLIYIFISQSIFELPQIFGMSNYSAYLSLLINAYYFIRQIIWQTNQNFLIGIPIISILYLTQLGLSQNMQQQKLNKMCIQNLNQTYQQNENNYNQQRNSETTKIIGDQTNINFSNNVNRYFNGFNNHISELDRSSDQNQKQVTFTDKLNIKSEQQSLDSKIINIFPQGILIVTNGNHIIYESSQMNKIFNANEQSLVNILSEIKRKQNQNIQNSVKQHKKQKIDKYSHKFQSLKEFKSPVSSIFFQNHENNNTSQIKDSSSIIEEGDVNVNLNININQHYETLSPKILSSNEMNKRKSKFYNNNQLDQLQQEINHSILTIKSPVLDTISPKALKQLQTNPFKIDLQLISKYQRGQIQKAISIQQIMQIMLLENTEDWTMSNYENTKNKYLSKASGIDNSKEIYEQNGEQHTDTLFNFSRKRLSDAFNTPIDKTNQSKYTINQINHDNYTQNLSCYNNSSSKHFYTQAHNASQYYFKSENVKSTKNEVNIICIDKESHKLIEIRLMKCLLTTTSPSNDNKENVNNDSDYLQTNCILFLCEEISEKIYLNKAMRLQTFKSKMLASISHELRTPLNCSIGMLQLIYDNHYAQKEVIDQFIVPALYSNKLLLNIINDILDFNQINVGNFKLNFTQICIKKLIEDTLMLVKQSCLMKNLDLKFIIDENFDPTQQFNTDPQRVTQIMLNLLSNAVKFTEQGGKITVQLQEVEKNLLKIDISDTGCGIPLKKLRNLFNNFGKVNRNESAEFNDGAFGAGLGLTISNKLAKGIGNNRSIKVVTQLYQGSTFTFYIQNQKSRALHYKRNTLRTFFSQHSIQTFNELTNKNALNKSEKTVQNASSPAFDECSEVKRYDISQESKLKSIQILDRKDLSIYKQKCHYEERNSQDIKSNISFNQIENTLKFLNEDYQIQGEEDQIQKSYQIFKPLQPWQIEQIEKQEALIKEKLISYSRNQQCQNCSDILIVDDNEFNILTLKSLLGQYELKVDFALNGKQAFEKVQQKIQINTQCVSHVKKVIQQDYSKRKTQEEDDIEQQNQIPKQCQKLRCQSYQLIFMDIDMPIMNGYQATIKILDFFKQQNSQIKKPFISTCSAFVTDQDKEKAKEVGMQFFIEKPIVKKKLEYLLFSLFVSQSNP
ncbi:ATPase, histidine kinase-, DNA gyrase B (macronuclear) [Tetrahymena thermophila SB210]|uniref:ATPase, histidine kinase-, DNA gyrase B n=1 Tax=Tetrahymena thermophila (strain SB210) TaxID=312017 RepID=W7XHT6_TETTS|nr:ATPase, histidine kinase-, DNA gyrase B [Tetrahymena thermophila SB210]EWS72729.1 ATPase, histidine kinase-, DNA gyrase B [Tetrahymena thermophila SB210]|eukprot:XP_012654736.1 ATPase, histidine kinase-, DNA gyrase B [Tetrahymena thermophila SB210]